MEEIYGEDNQLGTIIWDKRNPKGDAKGIAIQHEYIVIYAKNKKEYLQSNPLKRRKKNAQKILKTAEDIYNKYKEENKISSRLFYSSYSSSYRKKMSSASSRMEKFPSKDEGAVRKGRDSFWKR